jgi:hypothetical protein
MLFVRKILHDLSSNFKFQCLLNYFKNFLHHSFSETYICIGIFLPMKGHCRYKYDAHVETYVRPCHHFTMPYTVHRSRVDPCEM